MQQIELDGLNKPVSRLVHGSTGLMGADDTEAFPVLDAAVEAGVNAFDTAAVYAFDGYSMDAMLGRWIRDRGARDEVVVIAKGAHPALPDWHLPRVNPAAIADDIDLTRERMGVDHLDLWLFHRDDPAVDVGSLVEAVDSAIAQGSIRAWGVSNWSVARIKAAIAYAADHGLRGPVVNSAHYSLATQLDSPWDDVVTLTGEAQAADRDWHCESDVKVVAWSALAGGFLSERVSREDLENEPAPQLADTARCYLNEDNWQRRERAAQVGRRMGLSLSQIALAWVFAADFRPMAIAGSVTPNEVRENVTAADAQLSAADISYINDGSEV
ncbi:MAG: aldo/keto reductase [Acidimicrobiaceae bacterium]|nr:aldo/keto reductase [Acidimicrobiaceae bacterium]MXW61485.1 aldo/keto reductase [Acidimicrobiaceae bacterium]MXW76812.1 aldo/keto reductase [Acidimicrobiaceae bacterium]MYC41836.1 aldo/keto reductase [Acidimicrobiaceae bacterium]MYD07714.1 aldo/keto reductase [Acidimicrobiaceae bacterium]